MSDNFSTVRFLSPHEIDTPQIEMVRMWQRSLEGFKRNRKIKVELVGNHKPVVMTGKLPNFRVELSRVNKWLNNKTNGK